jgi:uncharacterized ubiquitin-like protein YukD
MGVKTIPAGEEYSVIVRVLPAGEELELDLPAEATGKEIIESLLEFDEISTPINDPEGNTIVYKLTSKSSGKEIKPDMSLFEIGVNNGDTLILNPTLIAG